MKMDYKINERYEIEKDSIILQNQKYDVYSRPSGTDEEYVYETTLPSVSFVYMFLSEAEVGGLEITSNNVEVVE